MLYTGIDLTTPDAEGKKVLYVGVYALRWGRSVEPTIGFLPATIDEVRLELDRMMAQGVVENG